MTAIDLSKAADTLAVATAFIATIPCWRVFKPEA